MTAAPDLTGAVLRGLRLVIGRAVLMRAVSLLTVLVLARLLTPSDFGTAAFGYTLLALGGVLSQAGLATALIRRADEPSPQEISAVLGFQLGVCVLIGICAGLPATRLLDPTTAFVVVAASVSLPVLALRVPSFIVFERRLDYRPLAFGDVTETVVFAATAIPLASADFGAASVGVGLLARSVAGTIVTVAVSRTLPRPAWKWRLVRPLLGFGVQTQATMLVHTARLQATNYGTAILSSTATLGQWSLAERVAQIPALLFEPVLRVSLPAVSQLQEQQEDLDRAFRRAMDLCFFSASVTLIPLSVVCPVLVPLLFGEQWTEAGAAAGLACLGVLLSTPVASVSSSFLYASGNAASVLWANAIFAVAWLAFGTLLLQELGAVANGVGWVIGAALSTGYFHCALKRRMRLDLFKIIAVPALSALAVATSGIVLATVRPTAPAVVAAACLALALHLGLLRAVRPETFRDLGKMLARSRQR